MKRLVFPILLAIVLSALLIAFFGRVELIPPLASQQGQSVDALLRALFVLASVVFSLVVSFILYSVIVFRRRPGDTEDGPPVHGNVPLEIAWTVVPLLIVLTLGGFGASAVLDIARAPAERELVIEVVGVQFAWSFSYPEYGITSVELVLPVGRPALFRIASTDVIHSFWIPEFRIKTDAIPGILNEQRITPTEVGAYTAYCSEICGTAHAYMTAGVRVVEEVAFLGWVQEQQTAGPPAADRASEGLRVAREFGCLACHSTDGTEGAGPTFQGLFGSHRDFRDGGEDVCDDEYIRNAIIHPSAQVVKGFPDMMPGDYENRLAPEQIDAIVELIKSLQ